MINKAFGILLLGISLVAGGGRAYAAAYSGGTDLLRTDAVDIELTEYEKIGMFEVEYRDNKCILPGDKISKIPRIENLGLDCYVRARVVLRSEQDSEPEWMSGITLVGMDDTWFSAADGYYYHTDVLIKGEDVDLFQEVWIPADLPQEYMEETFYLDILVEAVQSTVVSPDYSQKNPWGDVEISDLERGDENPDSPHPGTSGNVKTGEDGNCGRYALLLGLSLWGAFLVICGRRRNRREGDG